jgi:predicted HicB family RNase H-like nuclease
MVMKLSGLPDPGPAKQQFNVYLPPQLIQRAKYRALDDQMSLSELVERALTEFLRTGGRND